MKKILFLALLPIFACSQNTYKAISNIVNPIENASELKIGINYEFQNLQLQSIYNLTQKHFIFATYNKNNSTSQVKYLFGDIKNIDINNSGFSFGSGFQKLLNNKRFKYRTMVLGVEFQEFNNSEYSPNSPLNKESSVFKYYKVFAQYNLSKVRENYNFGYAFKLSYFKIIEDLKINNEFANSFKGKNTIMIDPTINFDYKILQSRNLMIMSQLGFSSALWFVRDKQIDGNGTFVSSTETAELFISPIVKIGIQYNFKLFNTIKNNN